MTSVISAICAGSSPVLSALGQSASACREPPLPSTLTSVKPAARNLPAISALLASASSQPSSILARYRLPCRTVNVAMLQSSSAQRVRVLVDPAGVGRWPHAPSSGHAVGNFDHKHGADLRVTQADRAPVRRDKLVRHGEAEAGTPLARGALEGLEQVGARLLRHARSIIADLDHHALAVALGRN